MVQPPWGTSDQPHVLEPASGASPAWYTTNFLDRGKKKLPGERPDRVSPVAQALTGNAWPGASESMMEKTGRRRPPEILSVEKPERLAMRRVERPEPKERPVGKRVTAQGGSSSGDHIQLGMRVGPRIEPPPKPVQQLPASSYGAPGTKPFGGLADDPGASRPPLARGFTAAATSQQGPVPLEPVIPRLRKVSPEQYYGTGAAGDMSQSFAPAKRPEDLNPKFYNTLKESPTFLRFVASLPPKPQVSPHQRHAAAARRQRVEEVAAEKKLVASLAGLAD